MRHERFFGQPLPVVLVADDLEYLCFGVIFVQPVRVECYSELHARQRATLKHDLQLFARQDVFLGERKPRVFEAVYREPGCFACSFVFFFNLLFRYAGHYTGNPWIDVVQHDHRFHHFAFFLPFYHVDVGCPFR